MISLPPVARLATALAPTPEGVDVISIGAIIRRDGRYVLLIDECVASLSNQRRRLNPVCGYWRANSVTSSLSALPPPGHGLARPVPVEVGDRAVPRSDQVKRISVSAGGRERRRTVFPGVGLSRGGSLLKICRDEWRHFLCLNRQRRAFSLNGS